MKALEIARRLAQLGQTEKAIEAYALVLHQLKEAQPEIKMEAAIYILQNGGNYRISYTAFLELYNAGHYRQECLDIMIRAFLAPNVKQFKSRYEKNCRLLAKYPYLFRKDFPAFDDLPIRFFPFSDNDYLPFHLDGARFDDYYKPRHPVIAHHFFKDLENPILAADIFSQYELEYLNDNVRKSEWVARENHIYLHYTDWGTFCSYLQVLDLRPLLEEKKFVFLIGDEVAQYPIDFKERFGIDYSQYSVKPVGIREVNKLIWHTQLSTHNGGDFFNEVLDAHPNIIAMPSVMLENTVQTIAKYKEYISQVDTLEQALAMMEPWKRPDLATELFLLKDNRTDKDFFVAMYLTDKRILTTYDPAARIVPALLFQPHFYNIVYSLRVDEKNCAVLEAKNVDELHSFAPFRGFKYIKTFTPMRRFTTSHGATVKFMYGSFQGKYESLKKTQEEEKVSVVPDAVTQRILNRSFMIDPEDRLYKDSVLVRFEDGKLNPKATFTALAAFLDIPYTESMTYCSIFGERDASSFQGNDIGFSTEPVYRTYDEYANQNERYYIEFFLRDAYEQ